MLWQHGPVVCPDGASVGQMGTNDSIMNSDVTGTPASDPKSQYNALDVAQLRLHIRF